MLALIATGLVLAFLYLFVFPRSDPRLPPGVYGWPVIGYLITSFSHMIPEIEKLRKKFGDVFLWRLGSRTMVFVCDPKLIRKAYSNPSLADRPLPFFSFDTWSDNRKTGLFNNNGASWQMHRRFSLRYMRDSGLGTSTVEEIIDYETEILVKDFQENFLNRPILIGQSINIATINVIWKLIGDIRFEKDDEDLLNLLEDLTKILSQIQGPINILDAFPWLVPLCPDFILDKLQYNDLEITRQKLKKYLRLAVKRKRATLDRLNPHGLIDAYLIELENDDSDLKFDEEALIITLGDLFIAGSDTTATTIRWGLLYLALYPEVQRKIQEEIDAVVPKDRRPRLSEKQNLPYTEAASHEVMRVSSLLPLGFFHAANSDTMLENFFIPKGTVLLAFVYGCHMDPRYWERPKEFYPEHFIDENGKFTAKNEAFMPFSNGRRSCLGESLAKAEIFMFLSALLQKFTFRFPSQEKVTYLERNPNSFIFSLDPKIKLVVEERK